MVCPSRRTVGITVVFCPNASDSNAESRPNDEITGGVLSTVTVNGVENGLTSPETVPAVAVKRYWPSGSWPGTAKSRVVVVAVCWPTCVPFM